MVYVDWRELYAQNQAAIDAAGVRQPGTLAELPAAAGPILSVARPRYSPLTPRGGGALAGPERHKPGAGLPVHRGSRADEHVLVHVPPDLDPSAPVAAVCMLHGCTQDPSTFAAATAMNDTADRHGFVVVYPGQPRARNAQGCWNWFLPAHQERGTGEPEFIAGVARRLIAKEFGQTVDPARIFVAGLSSGGAMALILAVCYPDLFKAVAAHSGLPYRSANDVASAFAVMGRPGVNPTTDGQRMQAAMGDHARPIPSLVIQGTADRTVAPANAQHILSQLMRANHLAAPETCQHDPARPSDSEQGRAEGGLDYTKKRWVDTHGALMHESIEVHGLGHAWSGGAPGGSYTDPRGPSASEAVWAFFSQAGE
ncbi:MAG TPA: PHB depolymerase family esterase [Solirubrobacteraceae bacterium]|nr:PHB depolymerase family esterase [Solirubrobacteraceae bacterium]